MVDQEHLNIYHDGKNRHFLDTLFITNNRLSLKEIQDNKGSFFNSQQPRKIEKKPQKAFEHDILETKILWTFPLYLFGKRWYPFPMMVQ